MRAPAFLVLLTVLLSIPACAQMLGDLDRNWVVDDLDIGRFMTLWRQAATPGGALDPLADLNADGKVDVADARILLNVRLAGGQAVAGTVEPDSGIVEVATAFSQAPVAGDGTYAVQPVSPGSSEAIGGKDAAGEIIALGLTDPSVISAGVHTSATSVQRLLGGERLGADTTAVSIVLLTPIFFNTEASIPPRVAALTKGHDRYGELLSAVRAQIRDGHKLEDYPDSIIELAATIALDVWNELQPTSTSARELPVARPWVEDVAGAAIDIVNPTFVAYCAEIRDAGGQVRLGPIDIPDCPAVVTADFSWPPVHALAKTRTPVQIGDLGAGTYYCAAYKYTDGLFPASALLSQPGHPAVKATLANLWKAILLALEFVPMPALNASALEQFSMGAGAILDLMNLLEKGEWLEFMASLLEWIADNADAICLRAFEASGKVVDSKLLKLMAKYSGALTVIVVGWEAGNKVVPYLYDLAMSPASLGFRLEQDDEGHCWVTRDVEGLHRPVLDMVSVNPSDSLPGTEVRLQCQVTDEEDTAAELRQSWQIKQGTTKLAGPLAGSDVRWKTPTAPGSFSATCTATDPWGLDSSQAIDFTTTETVIIIE